MGFWSSLLGAAGTAVGAVFGGPVGAGIGGAIGSGLGGIGDASDESAARDRTLAAQKNAAFAKTYQPIAAEMPTSRPIQAPQVATGLGAGMYHDDILDEFERRYGGRV
jgi:hypothetical protein